MHSNTEKSICTTVQILRLTSNYSTGMFEHWEIFYSSVQNSRLTTVHVGSNTDKLSYFSTELAFNYSTCAFGNEVNRLHYCTEFDSNQVQACSNTEQLHYSTEPAGYNHYTYLITARICFTEYNTEQVSM